MKVQAQPTSAMVPPCALPNFTDLVYEGYVGGSNYSETGGVENYLCLPKDPEYNVYDNTGKPGGRLYGAEYEIRDNGRKHFSRDLYDNDVPCAVFLTKRSSLLMVPARMTCPGGWKVEYRGYLLSGHHTDKVGSEFVCLDGDPEVVPGGGSNDNGKLFYVVQSVFGPLKCPPYHARREVTCAVCSK